MMICCTILFGLLAISSLFVQRLKPYNFVVWVLFTASLALLKPSLFISWGGFEMKKTIPSLVQITLLGMGMTLTFADFRRVVRMPKPIFLGMLLQFSILPFASLLYIKIFGLSGEIAAGLILMGSVSGGTASNVVTYLARGNVPLSITMTACSTMMAPLATPFLFKMLAGAYIAISFWGMALSIIWMIILPLVIGLLLHLYLPTLTHRLEKIVPGIAMFAICMIIGITIAISREDLLQVGFALGGAAVCLMLTGLSLGYLFARLARLNGTDSRTMAIEVSMQNGGMVTGLAFDVLKQPLAALGAAVYGPLSAVLTAILASHWRNTPPKDANGDPDPSSTNETNH